MWCLPNDGSRHHPQFTGLCLQATSGSKDICLTRCLMPHFKDMFFTTSRIGINYISNVLFGFICVYSSVNLCNYAKHILPTWYIYIPEKNKRIIPTKSVAGNGRQNIPWIHEIVSNIYMYMLSILSWRIENQMNRVIIYLCMSMYYMPTFDTLTSTDTVLYHLFISMRGIQNHAHCFRVHSILQHRTR